MTSFGVTPEGYRLKTYQDAFDEMVADAREAFGPKIDTQADSVLGQIFGIVADQVAETHEVMQGVNAARKLDGASKANLDDVVALGGLTRRPASRSEVTGRLPLAGGTTLLAGRIISVGANGPQFRTKADVTNAQVYAQIIDVEFEAVNTGPIIGNAETIDTIQTPVSGWSSKATVQTLNAAPFNMTGTPSMKVFVDGSVSPQTIGFVNGDFVTPSAATAAEVATKINNATTGLTATALSNGKVQIESDTSGTGSQLQIEEDAGTFASATAILGLSCAKIVGFNPDRPATKVSGNAEAYASLSGLTLLMSIDGAAPVMFTFVGAITTARAAASQIMGFGASALAGVRAYDLGGRLAIETETAGAGSTLAIVGGTANPILGFDALVASGEGGDAVIGTNDETDSELRARYLDSRALAGSSTVASIRAAVRSVIGVTQCFVLENETNVTDVDGLPPHSVEVVVAGGDDDDIANAIFAKVPAGTETYRDPGASGRTVIITDDEGYSRTVNFSRPTNVRIYMDLTVQVDPLIFGNGVQADGIEQVRAVLAVLALTIQLIGKSVISLRYQAEPFKVAGVLDVPDVDFFIDDVFPPVSQANIVLTARQIAALSTADIAVTVTT